jgi:hypothetical protein
MRIFLTSQHVVGVEIISYFFITHLTNPTRKYIYCELLQIYAQQSEVLDCNVFKKVQRLVLDLNVRLQECCVE